MTAAPPVANRNREGAEDETVVHAGRHEVFEQAGKTAEAGMITTHADSQMRQILAALHLHLQRLRLHSFAHQLQLFPVVG